MRLQCAVLDELLDIFSCSNYTPENYSEDKYMQSNLLGQCMCWGMHCIALSISDSCKQSKNRWIEIDRDGTNDACIASADGEMSWIGNCWQKGSRRAGIDIELLGRFMQSFFLL